MARFLSSLVFCGCIAPLPAAAQRGEPSRTNTYPDWFVSPPRVPGLTAVGYSPAYGDTSTSLRVAREDGIAALRVRGGVRLRAEYLQEILTDGSVAYRGEDFAEDTLGSVSSAAVADSAFLFRMVLVLVSSDSLRVRSRRIAFASRAPAWIETTPPSDDGEYSVGTSSAHFNEHEAWKEAERQARRSLAFAAATQMRSAMESRTGGTANGALIASTATELRDVEVRERWRDDRRLYVLIHARIAGAAR